MIILALAEPSIVDDEASTPSLLAFSPEQSARLADVEFVASHELYRTGRKARVLPPGKMVALSKRCRIRDASPMPRW